MKENSFHLKRIQSSLSFETIPFPCQFRLNKIENGQRATQLCQKENQFCMNEIHFRRSETQFHTKN